MARYIDADKFKTDLAQACVHKAIVTNVLDRQPTADVVEVVRCKDCAWRQCLEPSGGFVYKGRQAKYCMFYNTLTSEDGYCHAGMRRKEPDEMQYS